MLETTVYVCLEEVIATHGELDHENVVFVTVNKQTAIDWTNHDLNKRSYQEAAFNSTPGRERELVTQAELLMHLLRKPEPLLIMKRGNGVAFSSIPCLADADFEMSLDNFIARFVTPGIAAMLPHLKKQKP